MARKQAEYKIRFLNEPNIDIVTRAKADIIIRRVESLPLSIRDAAYDLILEDIEERIKSTAKAL